MAGPGRPRGTGKPIISKHKTMPAYLKGSTGKSIEEMFKVTPEPKVLIPVISDDYHRIKKDPTRKMNPKTLKYLKEKGFIKSAFYFHYSQVSERPEERTLIPDRSVIETCNDKLIWLYESV